MAESLLTYYHTVRHLRPVQVYARLRSRLPRRACAVGVPPLRARHGSWTTGIARPNRRTDAFRFRFLNQECEPAGWNDEGLPRLWLYNLHYFDAPEADLIANWIERNPCGETVGWEPYPTSVRIVNWIKWILCGGDATGCIVSLARQAHWLSRRLEYHLLANHLIANAKALIFAGYFFTGADAERWLRIGFAVLEQEIRDQILADGGHVERSPMYHSIVLEDLLDVINLSSTYPGSIFGDFVAALRETAGRMLGFLNTMSHPDGQISFFNDASFEVAPQPAAIEEYAGRLGVCPEPAPLSSGYFRLEQGEAVCIFDAAPIGPDYQPGHSHADTLSFELSHRGRRILVNSGISTYEPGPQRRWERSTAAHNTIRIDGVDQSEIWSAFRCARRARPLGQKCEQRDGYALAEAAHDGYTRLVNPVVHRRILRLTPRALDIEDRIEGSGQHKIELFFYLHPEISQQGARAIDLDKRLRRTVADATWYPEFGISIPNRRIVGSWTGICPATFHTRVYLEEAR